MHGGRSLAGPASKTFKHGKHSRYLPARLLERFREAETDTELLSLRHELALVDARIDDVLARVDTGESCQAWKELGTAFGRLTKARTMCDVVAEDRAIAKIGALIARGRGDRDAWDDVRALIHDRRRLVAAEQKRRAEMQQTIDVADAVALMALLVDAVRATVRDDDAIQVVAAEFARLAGAGKAGRNGRISVKVRGRTESAGMCFRHPETRRCNPSLNGCEV